MESVHIKIHGIVQGVGFRPFVHRLVRLHGLAGTIRNTSSGVELELDGERAALEAFVADLPGQAPKLAVIEKIEAEYGGAPRGFADFSILKSHAEETRDTLISPDIGICDDCLRELLDPRDRRYRYPFINCTNCGPRFTIIRDVPYDRALTSMSRFPMCPDCDREYHDIENRRYHAQPDACPVCGPHVFFLDGEGREVPGDAIETARAWLKAGKILAIKGLGGMHLACMAQEDELVRELRRRKERDEKPFAIMCRDLAAVKALCRVTAEEEAVLCSFRKPIVLLRKRDERPSPLSENGCLGVMLPYTTRPSSTETRRPWSGCGALRTASCSMTGTSRPAATTPCAGCWTGGNTLPAAPGAMCPSPCGWREAGAGSSPAAPSRRPASACPRGTISSPASISAT